MNLHLRQREPSGGRALGWECLSNNHRFESFLWLLLIGVCFLKCMSLAVPSFSNLDRKGDLTQFLPARLRSWGGFGGIAYFGFVGLSENRF
jgi:hypothetical protein